jgi:ATP-binding cassette subfamily F protein 3
LPAASAQGGHCTGVVRRCILDMAMIQLTAAGKRFGHKLLFEGADWQLNPRDRVGLVGANGTGKTTLLRVLAGLETLEYGTCSGMKSISSGYLPQDGLTLGGNSVFGECMSVFSGLQAMEQEMEHISSTLSELDTSGPDYAIASERLHRLQDEFRVHDGYALEAKTGAVLGGLGFRKDDWPRRTEEFSGGWQMRIALAKLLLQQPNLLLLDEPTNHLDLEARNWLEDYLHNYPHAFVIISHDRFFLDATADQIVEIWNKRLYFYKGNYAKYLDQKTQRFEQLSAAAKNQRDRIEQLEVFINRFRYQATKAKQVQSRIKELEKIERIELPPEEKTIHFTFPQPKPSGRSVVELRRAGKSYGSKRVLSDVDLIIERGDRVALVGANGAGKSTLIRLLAGRDAVTSGEYKLGQTADPGYFAQDQYKELNTQARVLDDLGEFSPGSTQTELRNLLGCFLFRDDDVFKPIGVLSGGERNRYALLRMLLQPTNFLLLDEPTNHLDLRAKDVLLDALLKYAGTLVFVSHDRYFIDKLATRVFEVANEGVRIFPGNYEDYVWRKQHGENGAASAGNLAGATETPDGQRGGRIQPLAAPNTEPKTKRLNPIRRKQLESRSREIEEDIARVEAAIAMAESNLLQYVSPEQTKRENSNLDERREELSQLLAEWEDIGQTLQADA